MDLIEQLEYPLPILQTDAEKLVVETTTHGHTGFLKIQNAGGGELQGEITSNNPAITLDKKSFLGNFNEIKYKIQVDTFYSIGDEINSSIVVSSNGGEKTIPVLIRIIPYAIYAEDGLKISTLEDFYKYSKTSRSPANVKRLFASSEFEKWLFNSGFNHMEIYREFIKDENPDRALENFFIFCKLKKKVELITEFSEVNFEISPNISEMLNGQLEVRKKGWGYFYEEVYSQKNSDWLEIIPKRINSGSFTGKDFALVLYKINTALVIGQSVSDKIFVGGKPALKINVKKKDIIEVFISKQHYVFNETGIIKIVNNSGKKLVVNIEASESFIKLSKKQEMVRDFWEIPFTLIKQPFLAAQMAIKKQPEALGDIIVSTAINGKQIEKTFLISAGDRLFRQKEV